jgi:hypothetical protein
MIHVLTSSYAKDFDRATYLNERVVQSEATHHIFVEQKDVELFHPLNALIHVKPDGGEGGLGRDGTMARFPCYKVMQTFLKEGDSYVQLDSDVRIEAEIIADLACEPDEIKGFFDPTHPVHLERDASIPPTNVRFTHLSGMSICAGANVFNKSIPQDKAAMLSIIDFMLDEGFTPSEDVMLSYLLRGAVKLTNLFDKYDRTFNAKGDIWVTKKTGEFGTTLFKES